jgi:hypothetical protein
MLPLFAHPCCGGRACRFAVLVDGVVAGETPEDLLADDLVGLEVGHELDELRLAWSAWTSGWSQS